MHMNRLIGRCVAAHQKIHMIFMACVEPPMLQKTMMTSGELQELQRACTASKLEDSVRKAMKVRLEGRALRLNRALRDVPGDGNCYLHAVLVAVDGKCSSLSMCYY